MCGRMAPRTLMMIAAIHRQGNRRAAALPPCCFFSLLPYNRKDSFYRKRLQLGTVTVAEQRRRGVAMGIVPAERRGEK